MNLAKEFFQAAAVSVFGAYMVTLTLETGQYGIGIVFAGMSAFGGYGMYRAAKHIKLSLR